MDDAKRKNTRSDKEKPQPEASVSNEQKEEPLNQADVHALMMVFRKLRRIMKRPEAQGKKSGGMAVMRTVALHNIEKGEGIRISEIAQALGIAAPTVTQFITGLEKSGWVERRMSERDRRSVMVFLTEEGRQKHLKFEQDLLKMFEGLALSLGKVDSAHLVRTMTLAFEYFESLANNNENDQK